MLAEKRWNDVLERTQQSVNEVNKKEVWIFLVLTFYYKEKSSVFRIVLFLVSGYFCIMHAFAEKKSAQIPQVLFLGPRICQSIQRNFMIFVKYL